MELEELKKTHESLSAELEDVLKEIDTLEAEQSYLTQRLAAYNVYKHKYAGALEILAILIQKIEPSAEDAEQEKEEGDENVVTASGIENCEEVNNTEHTAPKE